MTLPEPPATPIGSARGDRSPESASPGTAPPTSEFVPQVIQLQDDLRVLIRHVTSQVDKVAASGGQNTSTAVAAASYGSGVHAIPRFHVGLLVLSPDAIARDLALMEQLYDAIAALTLLSAPADVGSIRLTHAFVRGENGIETSPYVRAEARRLVRWAWFSAIFGLLVFFLAVALLIHVDRGRRAVQQLEMTRTDYQAIANEFVVARTATMPETAAPLGPFACPEEPIAEPPGPISRAVEQQRMLCSRMRRVQQHIAIVYRELSIWNTISDRLSYASPLTWFEPRLTPVAGLPEDVWQSTELRTATMMTALSGFVLPMLLGLLGACVYVYRELDAQIEAYTLAAREGVHGTLRMLLGAILGGLLGAIWTNGQAIHLEGVPLSLGALAFFVGFSVEVVFRLVDTLVRAVAVRIGKPTN